MPAPTTTVKIGFEASTASSFTLDDSVRGVLDNTDYTLSGIVPTDVTSFVRGVSVRRGKSRILENKFQAGVASVVLDNRTRDFDPTYSAGQFFDEILPRRDVTIESAGTAVYQGQITGWDFSYVQGGDAVAAIDVADAFSLLANQTLGTAYAPIAQGAGARIDTVLSRPEVAWSGGRAIETGLSTLQADTIEANQNVLSYLQLIEQGEPGALFVTKSGAIAFEERNKTPTQYTTFSFSDDQSAPAIPYISIETDFTDELVYNRISVTRKNGTEQIVEDETSQATYGVSTLTLSNLLLADDAQSLNLANLLLGLFKDAQLRFKTVRVALHSLSTAKQNQVLGLELNDVVQVKFLPGRNFNAVGSEISKFAFVEGIAHEILPEQHFVTFQLASTDTALFVLDDVLFGILDQNLLGY